MANEIYRHYVLLRSQKIRLLERGITKENLIEEMQAFIKF